MNSTLLKNIKIFIFKHKFYFTFLLIFIIFNELFASDDTISDIAYDVNPRFGFTVYVKEDGEYNPYLVLTNDYGADGYSTKGNVLLLRKYIMDEDLPYDDKGRITDYTTSYIDKYLNGEFLNLFELNFRNSILASKISVFPTIQGWKEGDPFVLRIDRKAFLLSISEMDLEYIDDRIRTTLIEGLALKYYKDYKGDKLAKVAYKKGEEKHSSWWLRTPYSTALSSEQAAYYSQTLKVHQTGHEIGVRPAFCVDASMKIEKIKGIEPGKKVYVFK